MIRREFVKLTTGSLIALGGFASPPVDGVAGSTSSDAGHTHMVAVSMADLQSVTAGQTIEVTTGSASSHTHVLTLVKIA